MELVLTPPQALGKPFTNWSLSKLKEHLARDRKGSSEPELALEDPQGGGSEPQEGQEVDREPRSGVCKKGWRDW